MLPSFVIDWLRSEPPGVAFGLMMVLFTVAIVFLSLLLQKRRPYRELSSGPSYGAGKIIEEATGVAAKTRGPIRGLLLAFALPLAFLGGNAVLPWLGIGTTRGGIGIIFVILLVLVHVVWELIEMVRLEGVRESLSQADYEKALEAVRKPLRRHPKNATVHQAHGTILFYAGRLGEAEQALRKSLQYSQIRPARGPASGAEPFPEVSITLEILSAVLMAQNRDEEATAALKASIKLTPTREPYNLLAEVAIHQNRDTRLALEHLDQGSVRGQRRNQDSDFNRYNFANGLAIRALALAMNGRLGEAEENLEQAIAARSKPPFSPAIAGLYWRCGLALRAMNQESAAVEKFEISKETDPSGYYGNLATSALDQHAQMLPRQS